MQRRSFMELMGGIGMLSAVESAGAANEQKTRYYVLEQFYLKNGTQAGRINEFMSKGLLPAVAGIHAGPRIFLEAVVASHVPQFLAVSGYNSVEQISAVHTRLHQSREYLAAAEAWEAPPEPPYEHYSVSLLEAADYSPEIAAANPPPKVPRVFELRTYHSPTWRQLRALHERFAGPEIRIFHRSGVHPVFYTSMVLGNNMPNLTYLIPFDSLAAREKAWAAFGADPEWVKVRAESIQKYGQISSISQIALFKATAYSPIR